MKIFVKFSEVLVEVEDDTVYIIISTWYHGIVQSIVNELEQVSSGKTNLKFVKQHLWSQHNTEIFLFATILLFIYLFMR